MSTPLTADERVLARAQHQRQDVATTEDDVVTVCRVCYMWGDDWPCDTIRLLDEVDEAWAAVARAGE